LLKDFAKYYYDDDLLNAVSRDGITRSRIYRLNSPLVVLGTGSKAEQELNLDNCFDDEVPILRRCGGGCPVVIDPGNLIISVAANGFPFGNNQEIFDVLSNWMIANLSKCGFPSVKQAGICDLVIDEQKISGACLHRSRDLIYYSATLLVNPDLSLLTRYLCHPPREPKYRKQRRHDTFVSSLSTKAKSSQAKNMNAEEFADRLRRIVKAPDFYGMQNDRGI